MKECLQSSNNTYLIISVSFLLRFPFLQINLTTEVFDEARQDNEPGDLDKIVLTLSPESVNSLSERESPVRVLESQCTE